MQNVAVLTTRCSHTIFLKEISTKLILDPFILSLEAFSKSWEKLKQHG